MTKESNLFTTYTICSEKEKVKVANGCITPISGKGLVVVSPFITLPSIIHMPNISCNLLSINKLTKS